MSHITPSIAPVFFAPAPDPYNSLRQQNMYSTLQLQALEHELSNFHNMEVRVLTSQPDTRGISQTYLWVRPITGSIYQHFQQTISSIIGNTIEGAERIQICMESDDEALIIKANTLVLQNLEDYPIR